MSRRTTFLIGLAAVLAIGVLYHGPLGFGQRFIDRIEAHAARRIAVTELPGVKATFGRSPLSRTATLSGPANQFQREGLGSYPGLNERVETIPGVAGIRWADEPARRTIPLLVETLGQMLIAYLLGIIIGRLWFGRRKRTSFLD